MVDARYSLDVSRGMGPTRFHVRDVATGRSVRVYAVAQDRTPSFIRFDDGAGALNATGVRYCDGPLEFESLDSHPFAHVEELPPRFVHGGLCWYRFGIAAADIDLTQVRA